MRMLAILLASAVVLTAANARPAQAVHGLYTFHLTKEGVRFRDFQDARNDCLSAATTTHFVTAEPVTYTYSYVTRNPLVFYRCITAKGYRPDPSGAFVARMWG